MENKPKEEYYKLDDEYYEMFNERYFPPVGFMHGYTEPLNETVEKLRKAITTGVPIPRP